MGNAAAFEQLPSIFKNLNEDNMVVLLQYLDVSDYVHLTITCRKFLNETLGPNNYLWAQVLHRPVPLPRLFPSPLVPPPPISRTSTVPGRNPLPNMPPQPLALRLANHVLQTTRNGRKFEIDGKPLDLTVPFDTLNKKLVSHFDFKQEIKDYYLKAKCATSLALFLHSYTNDTNANAQVVVEKSIKLEDYFSKTDPAMIEAVTDATFVVNLSVDPSSLEKLKNKVLPAVYKSRRVVYQKINTPAMPMHFFSRSRMMPPPIPYPNLVPQQQQQSLNPQGGLFLPQPPQPYPQPFPPQPYPQPNMAQPYPTQQPYPQPYPQPQQLYQPYPAPQPYPGAMLPQPPQPKFAFTPVQPPPILPAAGGHRSTPIPQQQQQQQPAKTK
eukprot:TRINITY_DN1102_c0_g1_i1.p1 TRINITY_DN1102_c0_g1~~TRINITY_DN1102_c0_g1_i1.p1  ORF type:complete len:381 (-),score=58.20 TRINITY_DN1102_c0_g1_i1:44-1186(-)